MDIAWETDLPRPAFATPMSFRALQHKLLEALSIYAIPIAIAAVTLASFVFWDNQYLSQPETSIDFQVRFQSKDNALPGEMAALLDSVAATKYFDTHLSETPVWFKFKTHYSSTQTSVIEFPSRHAVEIQCWNGITFKELGFASNKRHSGIVDRVKAGFSLQVDQAASEVICKTQFIGPARLTAVLWTAEQLSISTRDFHHKAGLLDGGILILAVFVLMMGLINKEILYLIFAAWLITALRTAAISAGWDLQWLGHSIPDDWVFQGRSLTRAAYAVMTVALFQSLFKEELKKFNLEKWFQIVIWLAIGIFLSAIFLSRKSFLVSLWLLGGGALLFSTIILIFLIIRTRSHAAIWYGASFGVTFASGLSEIFAAAYGIREFVGLINSVTAALASCLLASLAIAEQLRMAQSQKLEAQDELQHAFEAMPIGLFTLDLTGKLTRANPAMRKILGTQTTGDERDFWQSHFGLTTWFQLYQLVSQKNKDELEFERKPDSQSPLTRHYLVKATLANDKIEGSLQDITDKTLATEELGFLASHDSLTKVLNRRGLEQEFAKASSRSRDAATLTLAYLDLDRFKLINDLYGHNAGDDVLKQVCDRISSTLSDAMCVGRVGGDEFVILLPGIRISTAAMICRGIVEIIEGSPFRVGEKAFYVRGSIGLIEVDRNTQMRDALSTADRACRSAKVGHHHGLVVYELNSPAFTEHQAEIALIEKLTLTQTIEGLYLDMQPIMSLSRPNDSLNFEVLLRMRDPEGNLVPVSRLIAAGEQSGRMGVIDRWVLATTLTWLSENIAKLKNTQFVCMNLSGASWNDEEFMEDVFLLLRRHSHVAHCLCIEITESVALHDLNNTRSFIDKVRGYGARVALDDFGAGYTSFAYLKELPADLLKIDGSFIVNINEHPANVSIVEAIVNLARNLGMKTIAEWAEDTATVQTLTELGVDYVQGYVIARPMLPELLMRQKSSAGFTQDPDLKELIKQIEVTNGVPKPVDLATKNIH